MSGQFPDNRDINNVKRNLRLNLRQNKMNLSLPLNQEILSSPDLHKLKVGTPELENMILNTNMTQTPTPSLIFPPARQATIEQENFAGGFVQALNNLHNNNSQQDNMIFSGSDSNTSSIFNDSGFIPQIKEEPQTVPNINNSPPMSPVDMEYQERMKLERKRQRNRLAASKCRSRKLERISKLEDKVKALKAENADLSNVMNQLKESVGLLKLEVLEHNNAGCQLNLY